MHLRLLPPPMVLLAIGHLVDAVPISLILLKLALIDNFARLRIGSVAVLRIALPLAFVVAAVSPVEYSFAVSVVAIPIFGGLSLKKEHDEGLDLLAFQDLCKTE